jgi:hypothetical protein
MIRLCLLAILLLSALLPGNWGLEVTVNHPVAVVTPQSLSCNSFSWGDDGLGALGSLSVVPWKREDLEIPEGWFKCFAECCLHYQAHGTLPSEKDDDDRLGVWLSKQILVCHWIW